jgi:hypothetical protein
MSRSPYRESVRALAYTPSALFAAASWTTPRLAALHIPEPLIGAGLVLTITGLAIPAAFLRENEWRKG